MVPSQSDCRSRLQTTISNFGQKPGSRGHEYFGKDTKWYQDGLKRRTTVNCRSSVERSTQRQHELNSGFKSQNSLRLKIGSSFLFLAEFFCLSGFFGLFHSRQVVTALFLTIIMVFSYGIWVANLQKRIQKSAFVYFDMLDLPIFLQAMLSHGSMDDVDIYYAYIIRV